MLLERMLAGVGCLVVNYKVLVFKNEMRCLVLYIVVVFLFDFFFLVVYYI